MISHVKFVGIQTRDQDRAVRFWTECVGFRVLTDQPYDEKHRWIELRIASSETRLVLFGADDHTGRPFHGAFACDNVDRTYQELVARGVPFVSPPKKEPWGTFATFEDPDGNHFVLSTK
jgi:predicted enzyme related to lactoylglutathione lyase